MPDNLDLPAEIARCEDRLAAIAAAKSRIEARAQVRFERKQADYEQKLAHCQASGKKSGGKVPKPPESGHQDKDQVKLTDAALGLIAHAS